MATHPEHSPQRLTHLVPVSMLVKSKAMQSASLFPGPSQLSVACSTFVHMWGEPGNKASKVHDFSFLLTCSCM